MTEVEKLEREREKLDEQIAQAKSRERGEALKAILGRLAGMEPINLDKLINNALTKSGHNNYRGETQHCVSSSEFLRRLEENDGNPAAGAASA